MNTQCLKAVRISGNSNRRRGSGFDSGNYCILICKSRQPAVKAPHSLFEHLIDLLWKGFAEICFFHTAGKTRCGKRLRKIWCALFQKTLYRLCWCTIISAAQTERFPFQFSLKCDSCQHIASKILAVHRNDQRRICIFCITGMFTHAVCHNGIFFRRGCYHKSTWAHTESIDAPFLLISPGKLIFSFWKGWMSCVISVQSPVNHLLALFDTHSNREWFWLQKNLFLQQHLKGIPGTVSNCQHHSLGWNFSLCGPNCCHFSVFEDNLLHPGIEMNASAQTDDLLSDIFYHIAQKIGADMRFLAVTDFFRRSMTDHLFENKAASWVTDTGGQLSIGKGSCSTFSKLDIAFR